MYSVVLAAMLTTGEVTPSWGLSPLAPAPLPPPSGGYNYDRAYQHFLSSPSGMKTFSSLGQGSGQVTVTPFGYRSSYQEPGYEHQRIGPSGWERYQRVPGFGGSVSTPFWGSGFRVPGYSTFSSTPPPAYRGWAP